MRSRKLVNYLYVDVQAGAAAQGRVPIGRDHVHIFEGLASLGANFHMVEVTVWEWLVETVCIVGLTWPDVKAQKSRTGLCDRAYDTELHYGSMSEVTRTRMRP